MARLLSVLLFITVMVALFFVVGLMPSSYLADTINIFNPEIAISEGSPIAKLLPLIAIAGGLGGVIAGGIFGRDIRVVLYGIATGIVVAIAGGILKDLIGIFNLLNTVNPIISFLIISPLIFVGIFLTIEWIVGKD